MKKIVKIFKNEHKTKRNATITLTGIHEHTNEILKELGYSKKEIEELRSNNVI